MEFTQSIRNSLRAFAVLCVALQSSSIARQKPGDTNMTPWAFPSPEKLSYRIEWRMVNAGSARLQLARAQQDWDIDLNLESGGLVSRFFRVVDKYQVTSNDKFCGVGSSFDAQEGKRHVIESEQFDNNKHRAIFDANDLVKNVKEHHEIDIAPCTHEVVGALESIRQSKLEVGRSVSIPIVNGKKMAYARIEAQAKETLTVDGKMYSTTRYEAFIFDNVVFRKKGSLLVWLTDDAAHIPVQMRFQMGFPIGNITLELEKAERS